MIASMSEYQKVKILNEDKRITRTRKSLEAALISLIEEKGYDTITVNDLCSQAGVNRGTFYNHFSEKESLLLACENKFMEELQQVQSKLSDVDVIDIAISVKEKEPVAVLVELFDFLREKYQFLHAVMGSKGDPYFTQRLQEFLADYLVYGILHEHYRQKPTVFVEYYVAFFASAYVGIIRHWIETDMQESSEEMALIAVRLLTIQLGEPIAL